MKIDTQLGVYDLPSLPAEAQRLERMGFDALWSYETQHDPFLPLATVAMATQRLKIGTNIAVAFARTPMATAMVSWDLQRASQGRFILGLGTQVRPHVERRFSATWDAPAARVREYVRCVQAIWDCWQNGTPPDFQGKYYQFRLMSPFFNPGPIDHPHIPVFLAGVNPLMCRTAGEVADGFHVHPVHSVRYLREVVRPSLDEGARKRGKTVADLELFAPVFAIMGETESERSQQERFVREQIAFYASTPNYRRVLDLHGWSEAGETLSALVRRGEWQQLAAHISDEMMDAFSVSAPLARLPGLLSERYQGLVHRVALYQPVRHDDTESRWSGFISAVHDVADPATR